MRTIESDKKSAKRLQSRTRYDIMVVISKCSASPRELSDNEVEATPEQKQRILQEIKARYQC